ncbi:MAG TPA: 5'/3'-nucleotidase SurE [Phycisphaerae bacterium]|nr:5'/3'-nucleotidase SurE [Phycisphaerae bacterium]
MIILTNDDGIDAPGLAALESAVAGEEVVVVAPAGQMSECSHCVTTTKPIQVDRLGERRFAVTGTPADCVRVALLHVLPLLKVPRKEPISVYSGINAGGNLGADVYISGTVAAVREAAFHGIRGVALSLYRREIPDATRWEAAAKWAIHVLQLLGDKTLAQGEFWNVNFPWVADLNGESPATVFCERSRRPLPVKYESSESGLQYVRGLYHLREYEPGSDIDNCFGGKIAISRIAL